MQYDYLIIGAGLSGAIVRRLDQASGAFFMDPPAGFCEQQLLTPRGSLAITVPGEADLRGADLTGADLSNTDLQGAENVTCEQLQSAENWASAYRDIECDEPTHEPLSEPLDK